MFSEHIIKLIASQDHEFIDQAIELLLALEGFEDQDAEGQSTEVQGFERLRSLLSDCNPDTLYGGLALRSILGNPPVVSEETISLICAALMKATGEWRSQDHLTLYAKSDLSQAGLWDELDHLKSVTLLNFASTSLAHIGSLDQVERLTLDRLNPTDLEQLKGLVERAPQLKYLHVKRLNARSLRSLADHPELLRLIEVGCLDRYDEVLYRLSLTPLEPLSQRVGMHQRLLSLGARLLKEWKHTPHVQGAPEVTLLYCPPGEFDMGSNNPDDPHEERPQHRVKITRGFWMGQVPVTQDLWVAVTQSNPSYYRGARLPVERVTWVQCVRFCNRLSELGGFKAVYQLSTSGERPVVEIDYEADGYRLPTEAEWEYAARAGTSLMYAGSDTLEEVAWSGLNARGKTAEVGQKLGNQWGFKDMSGNVWEWCADDWDLHTYRVRHGFAEDPITFEEYPRDKVMRGGSVFNGPFQSRNSYRYWRRAQETTKNIGMRLVRSSVEFSVR